MTSIDAVLAQIKDSLGLAETPALFQRMAGHEAYLRTTWEKYQNVMPSGEIDVRTKEWMGLAVAVAKSSEYMIAWQRQRLRQAGADQTDELEALAVVDFFEGLDAFAHALHVDSDIRLRRLQAGDTSLVDKEIDVNVSYVVEPPNPEVRAVYDELTATMGIPFIPNIFKAMAHQPAVLRAKWEGYKAIMTGGQLGKITKELIAVAVSAVNACFY